PSQGEEAHAFIVKWFFGAWRDFGNDRSRVADVRRMVHGLSENLQMPVMERGVPAISRFRLARISQIQPACQLDDLIFKTAQLIFARWVKICATRGIERRVVRGDLF